MMYCQDSLSAVPNKLLKIDFNGIETEPKLILIIKQIIRIKANTKKGILYVLLVCNYSKGLKKYGL